LLLYQDIVYTSPMDFFRQAQKHTLILWTVLLSLSILCAQGVKLHAHDFDHGHTGHHHDQLDSGYYSDHAHAGGIHFANDKSHVDHHSGAIPELDASPDGLLKKVSNAVLVLALLSAMSYFLLPGLLRQTYHRIREQKIPLPRRYIHSPPLRAPPKNVIPA
jgi:hypothetical protein